MKKTSFLKCIRACAALLVTVGSALAQNAGPIGSNAPTVTIRTTDGTASEAGDPGAFTVSRGEQTNGDLYVWLQISGTASNGVDYQIISNIVIIPDGARIAVIPVLPINDISSEPTENVSVRVVPSPLLSPILQYLVGFPSSASLFLLDNDINTESNRPPVVTLVQPGSNITFRSPINIAITAEARDPDGTVAQVEFFAGDRSLGVRLGSGIQVGSASQFTLVWSNAPAGEFNLFARATDNRGASTTSAARHIIVTTNHPPPPTNRAPEVKLIAPGNGATFRTPANVVISADARDFDGFVAVVEFFAGNQSLGVRTNNPVLGIPNNPVSIVWSNVPPGDYTLTAKATDNLGARAVSSGVLIAVITNTPPPPPTNGERIVVNIIATDPHASEGLVMWCSNRVVGVNAQGGDARWMTNCPNVLGTNTATFTVRRSGSTSNALRVYYAISGSASNGIDYARLPDVITIPPGRHAAQIVVVPIDDMLPERIETVALRLRLPPLPLDAADSPYSIDRPDSAAAFIADNDAPAPPCAALPDGMFHACDRITNQCFRVEISTNLLHWDIVCTNSIADGVVRHIDPDATNHVRRFFRFVPVPCRPEQP